VLKKAMTRFSIRSSFIGFVALLFLVHCGRRKSELVWDKDFPVIGSQSSPRAADLNGDGVLDIVMGAGQNEFQFSKQGILALNGKTGELLWQQAATDQVYGSATFCDITGDGVKDVFIGGRSPHFRALNGKTGAVLWEYSYDQYKNDPIMQYARFNFNNSVLVPDQNNDGLQDDPRSQGILGAEEQAALAIAFRAVPGTRLLAEVTGFQGNAEVFRAGPIEAQRAGSGIAAAHGAGKHGPRQEGQAKNGGQERAQGETSTNKAAREPQDLLDGAQPPKHSLASGASPVPAF